MASVEVFLPVIQGPPPFVHRGAWQPGAYLARDSVGHLGSTWFAERDTVEAPGPGAADWSILLDGAAAQADRVAAAAAAALSQSAAASAASAASTSATNATVALQAETGAMGARGASETARDEAQDAVAPVLPIVTRIHQTTADRTNVTADMIINPALLLTIDAA
ncbi:hypothetical protein V5G24_23495 [Xanthobacter sp. VTT E-85241]|uniref:hypothetical protein n=1 Tax=Roseixanthobacter finlandensis TaxID=3119922 RepID=UPI003726236F